MQSEQVLQISTHVPHVGAVGGGVVGGRVGEVGGVGGVGALAMASAMAFMYWYVKVPPSTVSISVEYTKIPAKPLLISQLIKAFADEILL